jgi:hypothetical protein
MNWYLLGAAVLWWGVAEYVRGRPNCPSKVNFALMATIPFVVIVLVVLAFIF